MAHDVIKRDGRSCHRGIRRLKLQFSMRVAFFEFIDKVDHAVRDGKNGRSFV